MLSPADVAETLRLFRLGSDAVVADVPFRGVQGQVWRVETSNGVWAVKELLHRQSAAEIEDSGRFQERVVSEGISAPAVIRTSHGEVFREMRGRQIRVYSWVDVQPPDILLEPRAVGALLADIHRVVERYDDMRPDPWYTDPVGAAGWATLLDRLVAAGHPLIQSLERLLDEQYSLERLIEAPTLSRLQLLHLDLWADNLRATDSGGLCVLDWDNCGPGDPRQELAVVLFEYCSDSQIRARALYDAYVDAGGPARIGRPEDFSMAIAQLGHILQLQCEAWLEATTDDDRRVAAKAILEFVERPLTRAAIDRIVSAVA